MNKNKPEVIKHVSVTACVPHRRSLMITKLMTPGCSSSSLTWSSSWRSSRYRVWATYQLWLRIYPCILVNRLCVSSPDGPVRCHLRHADQPDDQPHIYWNGEDRPQMLVQQGEEPGSATRWRRAPSASHCVTALTHRMESLQHWFINESRKACRRGSFLLSWLHLEHRNLYMNVYNLYIIKSILCFWPAVAGRAAVR